MLPVRQPDSDRFRYWEVAGASHVSLPAMASSSPRMERDFGFSIPLDESMQAINQVSVAPVVDAALHHLQSWLTDGTPAAGPTTHHLRRRSSRDRAGRQRHRSRGHPAPPGRGPTWPQQRHAAVARHLLPARRVPHELSRSRRSARSTAVERSTSPATEPRPGRLKRLGPSSPAMSSSFWRKERRRIPPRRRAGRAGEAPLLLGRRRAGELQNVLRLVEGHEVDGAERIGPPRRERHRYA